MADLEKIKQEFLTKLNLLTKEAEVLNLKAEYVGKNGVVSEMLKSLKDMNPEERKAFGPKANELKDVIQEEANLQISKIEVLEINEKLAQDRIDTSLTENIQVKTIKHAGLHPRTLIQQEIEDIFLSMGFDVLDGP
ncbi:MAG: phenylalanine--tRNA ligase subunit alpha, partial [Bacteriovorax sp.]|nr:phenylalanine--tRNA ligase subunit alpha [Bacteriovorax sp.]